VGKAGQTIQPAFGQTVWYKDAVHPIMPGYPGAAVLLGHIDTKKGAEPFWNLQFVHVGDEIQVRFSCGEWRVFKVTQEPSHEPKTQIKYDQSVWRPVTSKPVLRAITCYPHNFNQRTGHYPEVLIVIADEEVPPTK
jgi:sortase (surface protein transpeptidase)